MKFFILQTVKKLAALKMFTGIVSHGKAVFYPLLSVPVLIHLFHFSLFSCLSTKWDAHYLSLYFINYFIVSLDHLRISPAVAGFKLFGADAPPGALFWSAHHSTVKGVNFQLSNKQNSRGIKEIIIENNFFNI